MIDLMISKLIVKKGRIEKSKTLNISREEWVEKVNQSNQVYFKEELFEWFQGNKLRGAAILSNIDSQQHCSLIYDDFWCVIQITLINRLEAEFIPKLADFAESFNAQLLISDTKPYPKEKIDTFKSQQQNKVPKKNFVENSFGENSAWFALKGIESSKIKQILHIDKLESIDWDTGIQKSYDDRIIITPPIKDWTFIHGFELPSYVHRLYGEFATEEETLGSVKKILELLSSNGGNAQFYLNNEKSMVEGAFMAVNGQLKFGYFQAEEYAEKYANFELVFDEEQIFKPLTVATKNSINPLNLVYLKEVKNMKIHLSKEIKA